MIPYQKEICHLSHNRGSMRVKVELDFDNLHSINKFLSFITVKHYNEALHPCDEDDECHLHDRVAPRDGHLAQGDKLQGVHEATGPLPYQQQHSLLRVQFMQIKDLPPEQYCAFESEHKAAGVRRAHVPILRQPQDLQDR